MAPVRVTIQPAVLAWAVSRTRLSQSALLKHFPKIHEWETGEERPTLKQAKDLAKKAHIPFGRLLLDVPTGDEVEVADFRTVRNEQLDTVSPELQEVMFASQTRLDWYAEYARDIGIDPPELFRSATISESAAVAASSVRDALRLKQEAPLPGRDKVRELVSLMEDAGILVARNSIAENSTRRALNTEEFRGFTLEEDGYCLVFINTRDAKTAQLFSLAHELAHVVLGKPGISDHSERLQTEQWCNRFAAAFLCPGRSLREKLQPTDELEEQVLTLSKIYGMSREALLWRLVGLGMVPQEEAIPLAARFRKEQALIKTSRDAKGAPPRHVLIKARVGERFFETVLGAAESGALLEKQAASLLGTITYDSFEKLVSSARSSGRKAV